MEDDDSARASQIGGRLDDPRLSEAELLHCVRAIVGGIARANRRERDRGRSKCQWATLLGRAARRSPAAIAPLAELLDDADGYDAGGYDPWWESVAETARDALIELGAPAVSALIGALERQGLRARVHAAWALERIGPAARQARAALENAVLDPEASVRAAAGSALRALLENEQERRALVDRLLSDPRGRHAALVIAWQLADRRPLLETLCTLLEDPDPAVRKLAANHLQFLHSAADGATRSLLDRLEHETDSAVRTQLFEALETVGTGDASSAEALFARVMGPDAKLAYRALLALAKREPNLLQPLVPALVRRFEEREDELGNEIAIFFQALGQTAPPEVVTAMARRLDALGANEERAYHSILLALESIGPAATSAIDAVERATRHEKLSVRDHAQNVLARLLSFRKP